MDHLLTRADHRFLQAANRNPVVKENPQRYVPAYIDSLIRKLAETYSQAQIAKILNQQSILRPNGKTWKQFHLCRYFQAHGSVGSGKWRGSRNIAHDKTTGV